MNLFAAMPMRGKIALGASVLAFVLVAYMLFNLASAPSYTTVAAGITPTEASKAVSTLQSQGIGAKLINGGTGIAVLRGKESQANVALATQGIGASQQSIQLNNLKLGSSSLQQQVAYQGALESQIAAAIDQIDGITGAQVQLTLPQNSLFAEGNSGAATAAVLLGGSSATLDPAAVKGIASLVASSVQGLRPGNVTIADSSGALLWPTGDSAGAGGLSKTAAESAYDNQLQAQLMAMLTSTLGPNKGQVQVHADLNVDQASQEKLTYGKKGIPTHTQTQTESLTSSGGGSTTGAAGTAANLPTFAGTSGSGSNGKSKYKNTTKTADQAISKTITKTTKAPGTVNQLSVALVLDKSVPAAQATAVKNAIATAAGVQLPRDTITMSQVAFPKAAATTAAPKTSLFPPLLAGPIKFIGGGLLALLFLFFMSRQLKRRESATLLEEPTWLKQLAAGVRPQPALAAGGAPAAALNAGPRSSSQASVLEAVQSEPDKAAQQLKAWITEDQR